jgi:hypothetical protein
VPDGAIPDDLEITRTIPQHSLVDSTKARALLGWVHSDPTECVTRSVRWHLDYPPKDANDDFSADDQALSGARRRSLEPLPLWTKRDSGERPIPRAQA